MYTSILYIIKLFINNFAMNYIIIRRIRCIKQLITEECFNYNSRIILKHNKNFKRKIILIDFHLKLVFHLYP